MTKKIKNLILHLLTASGYYGRIEKMIPMNLKNHRIINVGKDL